MRRIGELTGIKGILCICVWLAHAKIIYSADLSVAIFFQLSGFLCSISFYTRKQHTSNYDYLKYKLKQIYPLHIITMIIGVFYTLSFFKLNSVTNIIKICICLIINTFLLQSWIYLPSVRFAFNSPSWFLSAIAFCWFIFPTYFKFCNKSNYNPNTRIFILFLIKIILMIVFLFLDKINPIISEMIMCVPIYKLIDFFLGCELANLFYNVHNCIRRKSSIIFDIIIIIMLYMYINNMDRLTLTIRLAIVSAISYLILYNVLDNNCAISKTLNVPILKTIGDKSIYVFLAHRIPLSIVNDILQSFNIYNPYICFVCSIPFALLY